jgi:co-chaperonin GroES (HSP10)
MTGTQKPLLYALPGYALVELSAKYDHIEAPTKAYESKTSGILIDLEPKEDGYELLFGRRVFWETYKEGAPIIRNGKEYTFIKIEDLMGVEDA